MIDKVDRDSLESTMKTTRNVMYNFEVIDSLCGDTAPLSEYQDIALTERITPNIAYRLLCKKYEASENQLTVTVQNAETFKDYELIFSDEYAVIDIYSRIFCGKNYVGTAVLFSFLYYVGGCGIYNHRVKNMVTVRELAYKEPEFVREVVGHFLPFALERVIIDTI